jgi:hypothetical protein
MNVSNTLKAKSFLGQSRNQTKNILCFVKELIEEGIYNKNIKKPKKIEIFRRAHKQLE